MNESEESDSSAEMEIEGEVKWTRWPRGWSNDDLL